MKIYNKVFKVCIIILMIVACTDERDFGFLDSIPAPTNVSATYNITQDNSGLVTITPTAEGATYFDVHFGDATPAPANIEQGKSIEHTYAEGTYSVKIVAYNIKGDTTETTQELVVSFRAPENLVATVENDPAVSKQVNITATADFASMFEFHSGEAGVTQPVATANIGETISYQYQDAGTYAIKVVAKGGAIQTTEYTADFEVTEILAPIVSAANPPNRDPADVISIYGSAYTNVADTNTFPDWGQGANFGSSWAEYDLNGDTMLQYIDISYQGIEFGSAQDVSAMEYIHLDVWTPNVTKLETSLISVSNGEKPVWSDLTLNEWTSIDIPISAFTDQGLTVADIHQLKFVSEQPWPREGTVFIDNIYFWKSPSAPSVLAGTWRVAEEAGSLKVGPTAGSGDWWSIDDAGVAARACYFDDKYVFGANGLFNNVQGTETWVEAWQGIASDACSTPVAPHDGSASATFIHDTTNNKITLTGLGAYIGLPKVNNAGELPNVAVPSSITYDITLSNNDTEMEVSIEAGTGVFWTYKLVKDSAGAVSPIDGTWKVASEAGALKVGPTAGSGDWWSIDDAGVIARACFFDDQYVFNGGNFDNILGTDTWIEGWQGGSDACGVPVAPHDNSASATFTFDAATNKITLNGTGAYIGIPKANNQGELPNVAVPSTITYDVTLSNNDTEMEVIIEAGAGVFWTFKLLKQ